MAAYRKDKYGDEKPIAMSLEDRRSEFELMIQRLVNASESTKLLRLSGNESQPNEGDVKLGPNGQPLVFRDSRWHTSQPPSKVAQSRSSGTQKNPESVLNIKELVEASIATQQPSGLITDLAPLNGNEIDRIKAKTGWDLSGYLHSIDGSAVRHILNKHGHTESRHGHLPVSPQDIEQVLDYVQQADKIDLIESNPDGLPQLRFVKQINGYFVVVEAIRAKSGRLAVASMRKVTFDPS